MKQFLRRLKDVDNLILSMVVEVIEFDDLVTMCDGDGATLIERLAASPTGAALAADVVLHETVVANHEDSSSALFHERY